MYHICDFNEQDPYYILVHEQVHPELLLYPLRFSIPFLLQGTNPLWLRLHGCQK